MPVAAWIDRPPSPASFHTKPAMSAQMATRPPASSVEKPGMDSNGETPVGAVFLGSTLHGLLLGHWYLVERRLPKRYMVISAWWYIGGVVAAASASSAMAR